jgi:hypothetical protein
MSSSNADPQLAAWVRRSCREQGRPETISDIGLVAALANLVYIAHETVAALGMEQAA